jgi:hypothetical protein
MGFVTHPQPWSATLSTTVDTQIAAGNWGDSLPDLACFFVASQPFWFFTGAWSPGVTNNATPGATGRGALLPAGGYSWKIPDDAVLLFRDNGAGCVLNGVVSSV